MTSRIARILRKLADWLDPDPQATVQGGGGPGEE